MHQATAKHIETVAVRKVLQGRTIWEGDIEVFDLVDHPRAKRCFAWSHAVEKGNVDEQFVAMLEIPPVISAETAVRMTIAAEVRGRK